MYIMYAVSLFFQCYAFVAKEIHFFFCKFYFQKAQSGELQYSGAHTRQGYLGVQKKGQNKFGIFSVLFQLDAEQSSSLCQ